MNITIVVTTINPPTQCLREFAKGAAERGNRIIVAGDRKTPPDFALQATLFLSLQDQVKRFPAFSSALPCNSYTRKNVAYLTAMAGAADVIVDTDDDNAPLPAFWDECDATVQGRRASHQGWLNAYAYFSDIPIWPRGFPLTEVAPSFSGTHPVSSGRFLCPIQQGLANRNPDVDAIYRLLYRLPIEFNVADPLILDTGVWCPFNSQNTRWWPQAFSLLYLPAHCSFRMTDIWRSFVAQRILWANGWRVSFHKATVYQDRNAHDLMRDFEDEVPGYLMNERIRRALEDVRVEAGPAQMGDNLVRCYEALARLGAVGAGELPLLAAWLDEVSRLGYL